MEKWSFFVTLSSLFLISEHMFYKLKVTVKYKLFKSKFIVKFNLLCYSKIFKLLRIPKYI